MKTKIAAAYLFVMFFFGWGIVSSRYEVFPWQVIGKIIIKVEDFVVGDPFDKTSIKEKLMAELFGKATQFESEIGANADIFPGEGVELQRSFFDTKQKEIPLFYSGKSAGYYLVYGMFHSRSNGLAPHAILIDNKGRVKRSWVVPFIKPNNGIKRLLLTSEGDLVTNNSKGLRSYSWCGELRWELPPDDFHHEMDEYGDDLYLWQHDTVVAVKKATGTVQHVLSMADIVLSNPDVAILRAPLNENFTYETASKETVAFDIKDPDKEKIQAFRGYSYHQNTVNVNDSETQQFPQGSLLLSFRNIDTVMIVDPETAKVLWMEHFDRQHSPNWHEDGITVFNNRPHFAYSTIDFVQFDGSRKYLVDGKDFNFHRPITGNHQVLDDGSIVFMANEPEFYHIDSNGKILAGLINRYDNKGLKLRNAYFIDENRYVTYEQACREIRPLK